MPGAHKIGAAISGPRITGGNFMDITLFLIAVTLHYNLILVAMQMWLPLVCLPPV